jgi:hypothetical protein
MALLMVVRGAERGAPSVRLVQDFGSPDAPATALAATETPAARPLQAAPVKRGRGRPPGSRSRKNGALPAISVN